MATVTTEVHHQETAVDQAAVVTPSTEAHCTAAGLRERIICALAHRFERPLYNHLRRHLGSEERAEKAFHEIWLEVHQTLDVYLENAERQTFHRFLFDIANRRADMNAVLRHDTHRDL